MSDVAFHEHGDCQAGDDGLDERPGDGALISGLGGVAVERCGDSVGSGALGCKGILEGGDVGKDGAVEFGMDTGDEFRPGFGCDEATSGAVQGDDVAPASLMALAERKSGVM